LPLLSILSEIALAMTEPALNFVNCPTVGAVPERSHRMAYWQWGDFQSRHVVLCVHGLTRQGRDFDTLARSLCQRAAAAGTSLRVICPDVVGRGQSDWLEDPSGYQIPIYAADMLALLAQLHADAPIEVLDWVGTSMGGLIGIGICGQPELPVPQRVRKLVLNDVGPNLEWSALQRIGAYLGKGGEFETLAQAAEAMWQISSSFGPHTPEQWMALCEPMVRLCDSSDRRDRSERSDSSSPQRLKLHYDPLIAQAFKLATEASTQQSQAVLWQLYDQISAETLLLRGAESDLLSQQTSLEMSQRGPHARVVEFQGVGHAPTLVAADQTAVVAAFLLE
jgi:pimeloyl-ACP methyl ester carboxylesterase